MNRSEFMNQSFRSRDFISLFSEIHMVNYDKTSHTHIQWDQIPKGQVYHDTRKFCKNTSVAIIQHHNPGTEGTLSIFHIVSDSELQTFIMGAHLYSLSCHVKCV